MDKFLRAIKDWFKKLTDMQKRQLALVCTAVFALFLTLSVIVSMRGPEKGDIPSGPERFSIVAPIPPDDLFLPEEPDYIPGVLLEREQKTSWNTEDAAQHWQDPLKLGEEGWREKIEASIDELLERVP